MSNRVCSFLVKLAGLPMLVATAAGAGCGGGAGTGGRRGTPPPSATCEVPASPADTSSPTTIVGDGTSASCTEAAFRSAVAGGGIVTFNCGAAPVTISVTSEVPVGKDTTIDGAGQVTLAGGKSSAFGTS